MQSRDNRNTSIRTVDVDGKPTVMAFVTITGNKLPDFNSFDAEVVSHHSNIVLVRVPIDNINPLANEPEVKRIAIERPLKMKNNLTREQSLVDQVHATLDNAGNAIKGKDVVVGIIDTGIDYNHITFKDAEGNSRVKRVINGTKKISTPSQIASLTTDNTSEDHGTHVAATAAGSYTANGFHGMAPEADLVLCGLKNNFSDASLLTSCEYIIEYAKSENKPCVINMSIGHNSGPHDGNEEFNRMLESLADEGVIFCIASGNEGDLQIYLHKQFQVEEGSEEVTDSVKTVIADYSYGGEYYENSTVEVWNYFGQVPQVEFYVVKRTGSTNTILLTSERIALADDQSSKTWRLSTTDAYTDFKKYYTVGYFNPDIVVSMSRIDGYGTVSITINGTSVSSNYYIGMGLYGPNGMEIHAWGADSYTEFRQNGSNIFTPGDNSKSFNPMCVGNASISVGAWNTRNKYTSLNGREYSYSEYGAVGDRTSFSSWGEGFLGDSYPDICAPGLTVFSAYNTYNKEYNTDKTYYVDKQTVNGKNYYWGQMSGTSMATPAVTGIIATWLQANPSLTSSEVRDIINETAIVDSYVSSATDCSWGAGKIDANAGLQKILTAGVNEVNVMQNQVLVYPNPNGGQFKVFTQGEYKGASLNVFSTAGALVHSMPLDAATDAVDVDLQGQLLPGIYLVQITGKGVNYSTRMIIK
ncbi:MAG: S8 family peptidase [Muribaculaceae bacterium]